MLTSMWLLLVGQVAVAMPNATAPVLTATDMAHVRVRAEPVLERYYAAVRQCGARPPFKPRIDVARKGGIIHYDQPTGAVVLYGWQVMAGEVSNVRERAQRAGITPQEAYARIFNETLVAHELGHWLQGFQPERRTVAGNYDGWYAEQNANRLMVAFLREHPLPGATATERLAFLFGPDTPNPVPPPAGTTPEDFFNANTMTIVRGGGYGWYQGLMIRRALAEHPAPRFCALVAEWLPLKG